MAGHVTALIVGDLSHRRALCDGPLSGLGYGLIEAATEQAALEALAARWEDIHVIALAPADETPAGALAFLDRLKGHPEFSLIPVLVLGGGSDEAAIAEAIQAGAFHRLPFPCSDRLLASVINAAVEGRKRLRQLAQDNRAHGDAMSLLESGRFHFRTPRQASSLAIALAEAVPGSKRLAFGLLELLLNAVEHGNLAIGFATKSVLKEENRLQEEIERRLADPRYAARVACLEVERTESRLSFTISDQGAGFDWQRYVSIEPERAFETHGRGIVLARAFSFDTLDYVGTGSRVVATLDLTDDEG